MTEVDDAFRFYFGAASGSSRKALRQLEEPHVMLNYATKMNTPWGGINRLFIDSGGYSFMKGKGEYGTSNAAYLDFIAEHEPEVWALRDYPCEPDVLAEHGRSVRDHQCKTTARHVDLLDAADDRTLPGRPVSVLQGWDVDDYLTHLDDLRERGALTDYVGIGSVCRRNQDATIREIVLTVADALPAGTDIHAFGVKASVLRFPDVRAALRSADSQSYEFRKQWAVLQERGTGESGWRDSAYHYLRQRNEILRLIAGDADASSQQTTLSEVHA